MDHLPTNAALEDPGANLPTTAEPQNPGAKMKTLRLPRAMVHPCAHPGCKQRACAWTAKREPADLDFWCGAHGYREQAWNREHGWCRCGWFRDGTFATCYECRLRARFTKRAQRARRKPIYARAAAVEAKRTQRAMRLAAGRPQKGKSLIFKPCVEPPVRATVKVRLLRRARWERARAVLEGDRAAEGLLSEGAAARAAGINREMLDAWVARSRERRPRDAPWVREIAVVWDRRLKAWEDASIEHLVRLALRDEARWYARGQLRRVVLRQRLRPLLILIRVITAQRAARTDSIPGGMPHAIVGEGGLPGPEQWGAAAAVLSGDRIWEGEFSDSAAARAAGVSFETLLSWVARSRKPHPGDPDWAKKIAETWDWRHKLRWDTCQDVLARFAFYGLETRKYDGAGNLIVKTLKTGGYCYPALVHFMKLLEQEPQQQVVEPPVDWVAWAERSFGDFVAKKKAREQALQGDGPALIEHQQANGDANTHVQSADEDSPTAAVEGESAAAEQPAETDRDLTLRDVEALDDPEEIASYMAELDASIEETRRLLAENEKEIAGLKLEMQFAGLPPPGDDSGPIPQLSAHYPSPEDEPEEAEQAEPDEPAHVRQARLIRQHEENADAIHEDMVKSGVCCSIGCRAKAMPNERYCGPCLQEAWEWQREEDEKRARRKAARRPKPSPGRTREECAAIDGNARRGGGDWTAC